MNTQTSTSSATLDYWLALVRAPKVGPHKFAALHAAFPNLEELFSLPQHRLKEIGLHADTIAAIKNPDWKAIKQDLDWANKEHCAIITLDDTRYPSLLKEISNPPPILFTKGDTRLLSSPQLAIVGSRNPTATGLELSRDFALALAKKGLTITSGLALGIDAASHKGALQQNKGKTIAVLGTGLEHIYPASHQQLAHRIASEGLLVSEFSPHTPPKPEHFPMRNRIISGLSLGVLVIEAAVKSGSLITARCAVEQGRDVFAIPGSVHNALAKGCHALLRQGAKLVECVDDVVEELNNLMRFVKESSPANKKIETSDLNEELSQLIDFIGFEPTSLDLLLERTGLSTHKISSQLLQLELKGHIIRIHGGYMRK